MWDNDWWRSHGPVMGPKLHKHVFGFPHPGAMRLFFKKSFPTFADDKGCYGLGPYELYTLALHKMRTGTCWTMIEVEVRRFARVARLLAHSRLCCWQMGALAGKGRLTSFITPWIHRLGSFSRQSLIFVPDSEYLRASVPQSCLDMNMEDCTHAGDGTIVRAETPRRGIFKQLKNAIYDSKTDGSGALGVGAPAPSVCCLYAAVIPFFLAGRGVSHHVERA